MRPVFDLQYDLTLFKLEARSGDLLTLFMPHLLKKSFQAHNETDVSEKREFPAEYFFF
jgi:hypothetical protein